MTGVTKLLLMKGFATDHTSEFDAERARKFLLKLIIGEVYLSGH